MTIFQHPLVYKVSSAWDSVTAENEIGIGVRELRRLDHSFNLEDWKNDIQEEFLPVFMSAFLRVSVQLTKIRNRRAFICLEGGNTLIDVWTEARQTHRCAEKLCPDLCSRFDSEATIGSTESSQRRCPASNV